MNTLNKSDFATIICTFANQKDVNNRYASFDLCYAYFHDNKDKLTTDIEKSCLYLWGYLASWGMLRGSSALLQRSPAALKPLIEYLSKLSKSNIWDIDIPAYTPENIKVILKVYKEIHKCIQDEILKDTQPTITLVTKIMLGVFGCIPAFDTYFMGTFQEMARMTPPYPNCHRVDADSLNFIKKFYEENNSTIDNLKSIPVFNFSGNNTSYIYTVAKLIDMYGFTKGLLGGNTLDGIFSVSPTLKVKFSKGNLQYLQSENLFRFAQEQYGTLDSIDQNYAKLDPQANFNRWTDLFAWGTGDQPNYEGNGDELNSFLEWGKHIVEEDGSTPWRTLSADEWNYLLTQRPNAKKLFTKAIVCGVKGLLLLPDNWVMEELINLEEQNTPWGEIKDNKFSSFSWDKIAKNGAVFLPIIGLKKNNQIHDFNISSGEYWSSTPCNREDEKIYGLPDSSRMAHYLSFTQDQVCPKGCHKESYKNAHLAVRLVRNC